MAKDEVAKDPLRLKYHFMAPAYWINDPKGLYISEYKKRANIILKEFNIEIVCITVSENGAYISNKEDFTYCPGYKIIVKDTVGSGDAFSAALMTKLHEGLSIEDSCSFANRLGVLVASMEVVIPDYNIKDYY